MPKKMVNMTEIRHILRKVALKA